MAAATMEIEAWDQNQLRQLRNTIYIEIIVQVQEEE
jgi:hypothetical protein